MAKRTIYTTEEELRRIVEETVDKAVKTMLVENATHTELIQEGITIDYKTLTVSFDPTHQKNVDTNDYLHPIIIENNIKGETVLSIFERKDNSEGTDGNPLLYALKGINDWKFKNPLHDIYALFRRFVSVTTQLNRHFDTLIMTPSNNSFNNKVFSYLLDIMNYDFSYSAMFRKLSVREVKDYYFEDKVLLNAVGGNLKEYSKALKKLGKAFDSMNRENNGIFSYKYIKPIEYRNAITKSLDIDFSGHSIGEYAKTIDDMDVLVFDDTVTSGNTISDSAQEIRNNFAPNSITFLTLFSPIAHGNIKNTRTPL